MMNMIIEDVEKQRTLPKGLSTRYYNLYKEQLELFHLLNGRAYLFFRAAS